MYALTGLIGKQIIQAEQGGGQRAEYGKALIVSISKTLTEEYGSGFCIYIEIYASVFSNLSIIAYKKPRTA